MKKGIIQLAINITQFSYTKTALFSTENQNTGLIFHQSGVFWKSPI